MFPTDPVPDPSAVNAEPEVPVTWLRVTRTPTAASVPTNADDKDSIEILQFSALSEVAAITVRETEVSPYFMRELPAAMAAASTQEDQADLGNFFTNYLIPDDFEILTANAPNLTFVVDETTAAYPWEMAAHSRHARTSFVGTSVGVSRQFHTVLSEAPGSPPPLNTTLKVLLIADPAPGKLSLPHARNEGYCVIEALKLARLAWKGHYDIQLTVRIGSHANSIQDPLIEKLRHQSDFIVSAGRAIRSILRCWSSTSIMMSSTTRVTASSPRGPDAPGGSLARIVTWRRKKSFACAKFRDLSSPMPVIRQKYPKREPIWSDWPKRLSQGGFRILSAPDGKWMMLRSRMRTLVLRPRSWS